MMVKLLALLLLLAVIFLVIAYTSHRESDRTDLIELPLEWPSGEEVFPRWCGSGTRMASVEAVVISCDAECYYLLRYWVFLPAQKEVRSEVPVEVRMGDEILLRRNITSYKGTGDMYVQTPIILIRMPKGAVVKAGDYSLEIPRCSKEKPAPPQVLFAKAKGSFNWEQPFKGLKYARLMRGIYATVWRGNAELSCSGRSMPLRKLRSDEVALISVGKGGCDLEVGLGRVHLP